MSDWIEHNGGPQPVAPFLIFAAFAALLFAGVFVEHWLSKWKWRRIASKARKAKEADQ